MAPAVSPLPPAVEMLGISKWFGSLRANAKVSLTVEQGEVHALVGENGAGKSTLMNVLYGLYRPDEGQIKVLGQTVTDHDPLKAVARGIGMVHQHFMLIPTFTVLENVMLGIEPTRGPLMDPTPIRAKLLEMEKAYGLDVNPDALVGNLAVSQQQRVEILKVLVRGARILLLDEPTAVLTPQEVGDLMRILRALQERGASIVFVTHKLREVMALSNRITVMRAGEVVANLDARSTSEGEIARAMVGRPVLFDLKKPALSPGEPVLTVEGLSANVRGQKVLDDVNLTVRSGEIVGLAGVAGNGQTELVFALAGLIPATGQVRLDGEDVSAVGAAGRFERGLACVYDDRLRYGAIKDFSVADNLVLGLHHVRPYAFLGRRNAAAVDSRARRLITEYDVRPPDPEARLGGLSGGNQQKVVIARECSKEPRCLIAALPTRGVDIGAIEFIHQKLLDLAARGTAILLISSELSEILSLADTVVVMTKGHIQMTARAASVSEEALGLAMMGAAHA